MSEYSIHELAKLSGVSSRTLRHYDNLGLLKPLKKNQAGYRVYGTKEVDKLQQILLHKASGLPLKVILQIFSDTSFDVIKALQDQRQILIQQKKQFTMIINTIDQTIKSLKGDRAMSDSQKFIGLKKQLISTNDQKYGEEVKRRWGTDAWQQSNQHFAKLTQRQFDSAAKIDTEFKETLKIAYDVGDPGSQPAQAAVKLHEQWLRIFWPSYTTEAHKGLAQMYVDDIRFHKNFNNDKKQVEFFRDAVNRKIS